MFRHINISIIYVTYLLFLVDLEQLCNLHFIRYVKAKYNGLMETVIVEVSGNQIKCLYRYRTLISFRQEHMIVGI